MLRIAAFVGKGGVGKTTLAAAFSLLYARRGARVLVVSLDPAHNLGDVLGAELSEEPRRVAPNLDALEVDYDRMVRRTLRELADKVKDIYGHLRVFNLEGYVDVLQHSPGVEEQAALETIIRLVKACEGKWGYDLLVLDTPPTGLTLRILALPSVSLIWVEKLIELRLAILGRRKAVERVLGRSLEAELGGRRLRLATEPGEDPIYRELVRIREEYGYVNRLFTNGARFSAVIVVNPEELPLLEAERAVSFLKRLGVRVGAVVVNRVLRLATPPPELVQKVAEQERLVSEIRRRLGPGLPVVEVPYMAREPRGLDGVEGIARYLEPLVEGGGVWSS